METITRGFELLFGVDGELRRIIGRTMLMSVCSTAVSSAIGLWLGTWLGCAVFRGKKLITRILQTLMSTPPVVAGLAVYLLLSRRGPLGGLGLLFTLPAMVIAQVILITPIITGLTATVVSAKAPAILETAEGFGLRGAGAYFRVFMESGRQLISVVLMGFGRAVAEVGAVQLVGGNIQGKTRVMTTAIMLETNMGNFEMGIVLGVILLLIAFGVNMAAGWLQE